MSNTTSTYSADTFKPATPAAGRVFAEIFKATPLYLFATALKAALQR